MGKNPRNYLDTMPSAESSRPMTRSEKLASFKHEVTNLSPAERAAGWRESVKDLPHTPPLSDEAISRESIYDARG